MNSRPDNPILGITCILIGMSTMSFMDAMIKLLSDGYPLHEIVMARSVIAIVLTLFIVHIEGGLGLLRTSRPWLHLARGLLIVLTNMAFYMALSVMPIAKATAIFFVSPLIITALSVLLLGEQVGWRRWLAVSIGFIGTAIMMRLGTGAFEPAAILPVIAACAYALTQIITRWISATEKASVMSFYISATFIVVSAVFWVFAGAGEFSGRFGEDLEFLFMAWRQPDMNDALLMVAIGFLITIVGYMISQAYRVADVNVIAPFEYIAMPMAILWGYLFWREVPDMYSAIGMILVGGSGLFVFFREKHTTAPIDQTYGIDPLEKPDNGAGSNLAITPNRMIVLISVLILTAEISWLAHNYTWLIEWLTEHFYLAAIIFIKSTWKRLLVIKFISAIKIFFVLLWHLGKLLLLKILKTLGIRYGVFASQRKWRSVRRAKIVYLRRGKAWMKNFIHHWRLFSLPEKAIIVIAFLPVLLVLMLLGFSFQVTRKTMVQKSQEAMALKTARSAAIKSSGLSAWLKKIDQKAIQKIRQITGK